MNKLKFRNAGVEVNGDGDDGDYEFYVPYSAIVYVGTRGPLGCYFDNTGDSSEDGWPVSREQALELIERLEAYNSPADEPKQSLTWEVRNPDDDIKARRALNDAMNQMRDDADENVRRAEEMKEMYDKSLDQYYVCNRHLDGPEGQRNYFTKGTHEQCTNYVNHLEAAQQEGVQICKWIEDEAVTQEPDHPMQPIVMDGDVARFKENKIVRALVCLGEWDEAYPRDLNSVSMLVQEGHFSVEDQIQLMQLIGYSVSAAGGLSFMTDDVIDRADAKVKQLLEPKQ